MGRDKSLMPIDGVPQILRVAASLGDVFSEVFVVANDAGPFEALGLRVVADILVGNDSLGGLHTAVSNAGATVEASSEVSTQNSIETGHVFVTGCDMPFLQAPLLKGLASLAEGWDVVIPVLREFPEPLCAVYSAACEAPIRQRIENEDLKMVGFHGDVTVMLVEEARWRKWDPEGLSFRNLNTPDDLERALAGR
ncbi:MAG: molybdenum cofactor guanylyltransferase [Nitrospinaceae bacterium]|jgi:molybdopterin-guanine dinucleotide biosynthesis protein A|nr:molybdenum cofactor guanylyltransferase [Nitrospinaceae bacterium]MBT5368570.1 molybdenum cofactor guanylyltransferase [Nitrospinaceae bacterium]MBT5946958.1 molybdenum cofactor guanylyltransferase [Nitrospinaceae bacterium]